MPTVGSVIRRLLPKGSRKNGGWRRCPPWPPDLFAVAATLVNLTGCYVRPRYSAAFDPEYIFDAKYRRMVKRIGDEWLSTGSVPSGLDRLWGEIWGLREAPLAGADAVAANQWQDVAMKLMAIADHASSGVGYAPMKDRRKKTYFPFPMRVAVEHFLQVTKETTGKLLFPQELHVPGSICERVPPEEATVLPKSLTAQVGCTLRSLSHNLALLPPNGIVGSSWLLAQPRQRARGGNKTLNVLLVPFPYRVGGSCFVAGPQRKGTRSVMHNAHHSFRIEQKWLGEDGTPIVAQEFMENFLAPLIARARAEVGELHAIVFPEGALSEQIAEGIAKYLSPENDVELLICGVLRNNAAGRGENLALAYAFDENRVMTGWTQKKGHRWALEQRQIEQYSLGHVFEPKRCTWWEQIDVHGRNCVFVVMPGGAVLSVMICEDLARFDPTHPVVRSVGPNLLVALLMDGPQLRGRWSGRYATVLADDPGCAVLSFTSIGMVKRSSMPGASEARQVGLWKQPGGDATELILPRGDHALVLTLSLHNDEQMTLDGRSDDGVTRRYELSGARGVRLQGVSTEIASRFGLE